MFAIRFNPDFWPGVCVRSSFCGGNDTESLLLKFPNHQGGYGILCVVCLTQPRYALTKAITRRGAIITVKILDILLIFSMCLQGTGRVARDSLQGRKWRSLLYTDTGMKAASLGQWPCARPGMEVSGMACRNARSGLKSFRKTFRDSSERAHSRM